MPDPRALLSSVVPAGAPARWLTLGTFLSSIGFGAFAASSAIFFTRSVGLTAREVGIGLAVAGVLSVGSSVWIGHLADRYGSRELMLVLSVLQALLLASYVLVHTFVVFLVVVSLVTVAERASNVVRNALISGLMGREDRVKIKAYQRSVFNLGVSLGALAAAVPLQIDTRAAYVALVLGNAVSVLVVFVCTLRLPTVPPTRSAPGGPRWIALRDYPYAAIALFSGLILVHQYVLSVGLPIWIVTQTTAPRSMVALIFFVNTVMSVLLQVWFSRGADTVPGAATAALKGGLVLVPASLLFGVAAMFGTVPAAVLLLAGGVLLTAGELWTSVATWGLSFELAVPSAQGQYQGVFALGGAFGSVVGPLLVTSLVLPLGLGGWAVLGAYFALLAAAARPLSAWAQSTRTDSLLPTQRS
jgi:predicted MFS family arabinose efflux permease